MSPNTVAVIAASAVIAVCAGGYGIYYAVTPHSFSECVISDMQGRPANLASVAVKDCEARFPDSYAEYHRAITNDWITPPKNYFDRFDKKPPAAQQ